MQKTNKKVGEMSLLQPGCNRLGWGKMTRGLKKVGVAGLVAVNVLSLSLYPAGPAFKLLPHGTALAASYTFTQNNWSGGVSATTAAHSTDQANWTKYQSASSTVATTTPASLKLLSTTSSWSQTDDGTSATGFNLSGASFATTTVYATGTPAAIRLASFDNGTGTIGIDDKVYCASGTSVFDGTTCTASSGSSYNLAGATYDVGHFKIQSGVTVNITGSNPLIIKAKGNVNIAGTLNLNGNNGSGQTGGGTGVAGGGNGGNGGYGSYNVYLAGANGAVGSDPTGGSGGGTGGLGTGGSFCDDSRGQINGGAGSHGGVASLTNLYGGSGGGGGGGRDVDDGYGSCVGPLGVGGKGGGGGGVVKITTNNALTISGLVTANGGSGAGGTNNAGSGGAGSGGAIFLQAGNMDIGTNKLTTTGGGKGRIRLDYASLIGTTTASNYVSLYTVCSSGCTATPTYNTSGTYTSAVYDTGAMSTSFTTLTYASTTNASTTVAIDIRAGDDSNPPTWGSSNGNWPASASSTSVSSGGSISALNGHRYVQYRARLSTTDANYTPSLNDITVNYQSYPSSATLTSSIYNTEDPTNLISKISWTESATTSNRTVKFQIRSSANGTSWSNWCGPNVCDNNEFFTYASNSVSLLAGHPLRDGSGDQYFQYRVTLSSDGVDTPILQSVTVTYVVNKPPEFQTGSVSASQGTDGNVTMSYTIRDTDTDQGSAGNQYRVAPSFRYSLDNGSTWTAIATSSGALTYWQDKGVATSFGAATTTVWNPKTTLGGNIATTTAKLEITINDNEAANATAATTTAAFTIDTKDPAGGTLLVNGSSAAEVSTSSVSLIFNGLSDDSQVRIQFSNNGSDWYGARNNGTASTTLGSAGDATSTAPTPGPWNWNLDTSTRSKTVYAKITDAYGNSTTTTATATQNAAPVVSITNSPSISTIASTTPGVIVVNYDLSDPDSSGITPADTSATTSLMYDIGITASTISSTSTTSVSIGGTNSDKVANGDVIQIDSEMMYLSTTSPSSLVVTRGYRGTRAATHSNGATVWLMANAVSGNVGSSVPLGTGKSISWTPASDKSATSSAARLMVTAIDGRSVNQVGTSAAKTFFFDTIAPVNNSPRAIEFDAFVAGSVGTNNITIYHPVDATTTQYMFSATTTDGTASTTPWTTLSGNGPTYLSWGFDSTISAKSVNIKFRDLYGNTQTATTTVSTIVPAAADAFLVQDVSKAALSDWRLYIAWETSTSTNFASYKLEYATSTDNINYGSFVDVTNSLTSSSTNYYVHTNLNTSWYYQYRLGVKDVNNNISARSNAATTAKPDGVQNLGEGGGGSVAAASRVENVVPTQAADKTVSVNYVLTDSSQSSKTNWSYEAYIFYNTGITLSTSTASTITVSDASKMPSSGFVQVNNEVIGYGSKSGNVLNGLTRGTWPTSGTSRATRNNSIFFAGTPVWLKATSTTPVSITNSTISSGQSGTIDWNTYYETALAGASYSNVGIRVLVHDNQASSTGPLSSQSDYSEIGTLGVLDLTAPTIQFSATSSSGWESATSTDISVVLSRAYPYNATVNYSLSGTATGGGVDYTLANGTSTISAGATSTVITLVLNPDTLNEPDETVILTLSSPTNSSLGANATHTYTILDDDSLPTVGFVSATSSAAENITPANFAVYLSATSGRDVTVNFSVAASSTASSGTDYSGAPSPVVIPAGSLYATGTATIINDSAVENDETLILEISSVENATTTGAILSHEYTILNDDSPPVAGFATSTASGSEATSPVTLSFSLSAATVNPVTIYYSVSGGTATAGADYATTSSSVVISAGQTSTSTTFTVVNDTLNENNETIIFAIDSVVNATTTGGILTHTYTIVDDDALPTVSFALATSTVSEASSTADILIQLSATSSKDVTVSFGLSGTATGGGADYSFATTTVTIPAGSISTTTTATITSDALDEDDETVVLTLSNPVNATASGTTMHTLTILDDDPTPTIEFALSESSGSEASSTISLLIRLSATSSKDVTVNYAVNTVSSTATANADYVASNGTATIPAGSISVGISPFTVAQDQLNEDSETVVIVLSSPVNADLGAVSTHAYTILDDENQLTAQFISGSSSALENSGSAVVSFVLSAVSSQDVTINFSVSASSTATGGGVDYATTSSSVVIPAGSTATSTSITLIDNSRKDGDKTVVLTISDSGIANAFAGANAAHTLTIIDDESAPVPPVVSNIVAAQQADGTVSATYNVKDANYSNKSGVSYEAYLFYDIGATLPAGAYSSASSTLAVSDASKMPYFGYVQVGKEVLSYTGKSGNTLSGVTRATWLSGGRYTATSTLAEGSPVWVGATSTAASLTDTGAISSDSGLNASTTWNTAIDTVLSGNYLSNIGMRILVHDNQSAVSGPLSSQNGSSGDGKIAVLDLKAPVLADNSLLINDSPYNIEAAGATAGLSLANISGDISSETIYIQFSSSTPAAWYGANQNGTLAGAGDWGESLSLNGSLGPWTWTLSGRSETVSVRAKDAYGNISNIDTNSIIKNAVPEFSGSVSDSDATGYATTTNSNIVIRQCNIYDTDVNCTAGKVKIKFLVRDPDTADGVVTPGYVNTVFAVSLNSGAYATSSITTYSDGNTDSTAGKSVVNSDGATYTTVTAYYDPGISSSATLTARVSVTDNESGTTPVTATSNTISYDKTAPSGSLTFDAGVAGTAGSATITIPAPTDANAVQYGFTATTTDGTASTTAWTTLASPASVSWGFDSALGAKSVSYSFRDVYGNISGTSTASSPAPLPGSSLTIDDITASSSKRVFLTWEAATSSDFANYRLEYATSSQETTNYGAFQDLITIPNSALNYYTHSGLDQNLWYRYRLSVKNTSGGNYSVKTVKYSSTYGTSSPYITAKPDGTLNGDESSANDTVAPTVSNVTAPAPTILASSAVISFDVSDNASSQMSRTIYYAVSTDYNSGASERNKYIYKFGPPAYVSTGTAGSSTTTSVTLAGLTKGTEYRYAVEVCDVTGNCAFKEPSTGNPYYSFTTSAGPAIVSGSISAGTPTYDSATITWKTDLPADSQLFYSASTSASTLVNPTTAGATTQVTVAGGDGKYAHSATLSGLSSNATYSYKVRSTDRDSASASYMQYDESAVLTFTTAAIPTPTMTVAPSCSVTDTTVTVNWTTDQDTTTEISVLNFSGGDSDFFGGAQIAQYPSGTIDNTSRLTADYGKTHTNTFAGLTENTTYYVKARSLNRSGGEASGLSSCKTAAKEVIVSRPATQIQDITPPVISSVTIEDISATTARILWKTDEPADTLVKYGATMSYGSIAGTEVLASEHSVMLSGLNPSATYNFKITSADARGNRAYAGDQSFTTLSEKEAAQTTKDELEKLQKELKDLKEKQESEAKKAQSLSEATARFKAILKSVASDVSLQDLEDLTTDISDTISDITQEVTPPNIIGGVPAVEIEANKATIKWRTNKAANSIIALAPQSDYNAQAKDPYALQVGQAQEEVKEHAVTIPDLKPSTVYHFQIRSKAKVGPEGRSRDFLFETKPELPVIIDYSFKKITENSITVVWRTNVLSSSLVRYTPFSPNGDLLEKESKTQGNPAFVQAHEVAVTNLPPNVAYLVEISSKDVTGTEASRVLGTVRTIVDVKAPVIAKVRAESTLFPGKIEKTQTIIYWETDEPSTSQIFWKEGVSKGDFADSSRLDLEYTTSHVMVLTNFKPGAVYRFQVESADPANNKARSTDYTVLTPKKGETVIDLIINNFQDIFGFLKKM